MGINYDKSIPKKLRETYGNKAQIAVCTEELCELAAAISKFIRYEQEESAIDKTKSNVLDEYCDVIIIQDHIKNIYGFTDKEINDRISKKIHRMKKWIDQDSSMEITTKIRDID